MKPRICLALEYPLLQQGGTEVLVDALVRGLCPHFEIVLVSGDADSSSLPTGVRDAIVAHLPWNPGTAGLDEAKSLAASIRELKVTLAHFHFGGTFEWKSNRFWQCPIFHLAARDIPCLSTNHLAVEWLNCGVNPRRALWTKHLFQLLAIASRSLIYQRLQCEICVSRHDQRRVQRMFPHFRSKVLQRYHSLLSEDAPPPTLSPREPVLLCVGTIGGRKAQINLVEAFSRIAARYPEWRVELIGRFGVQADVDLIRRMAKCQGLTERVRLPGRLPDAETLQRMKTASIFVMPSLQEGLGLSLQEALFHGCVGVGTIAGGIPELIDDRVNGILVPPGDVGALAAALNELISDPLKLERMRTESRASILRKRMTLDSMTRNYEGFYRRILTRDNILEPGKRSE